MENKEMQDFMLRESRRQTPEAPQNPLDKMNRHLDNSSPNETDNISQIFEK